MSSSSHGNESAWPAPLQKLMRTLDRVDLHPAILLAFVLVLDVLVALRLSLFISIWHDELFTYAIAQAPTLHDLMFQIKTIDLNPPLSYLLTRWSFRLFGVGTLQCRLPEMLGFLLALAATFFFVRRRAGSSYGMLASAVLLSSLAGDTAMQARPYGLMLGFTALALLAWQNSRIAEQEGRRSGGQDALLAAALSLLLLSHIFGLLGWAAVAFAEFVSALPSRRIHWSRLSALLLPLGITPLYAPLLRDHGTSLFPPAFQPHLSTIAAYYVQMTVLSRVGVACWLAAGIAVLLRNGRARRVALQTSELLAALALFLFPAVLMVRLLLQHAAFFDRYGLLACLGMAILVSVALHWIAGGRPAAAIMAALLILVVSGRFTYAARAALTGHVFRHTEPSTPPFPFEELADRSLPIVDASGLAYVEMNHREAPANLSRVWYLTGGDAAIQYAHATIFESMATEKDLFHFPANVDTFQHFTAEHKHFYVFGTIDYPEDWLLRKLKAQGATLVVCKKFMSAYHDSDIYNVTLPD